jgi:hypothetical protein
VQLAREAPSHPQSSSQRHRKSKWLPGVMKVAVGDPLHKYCVPYLHLWIPTMLCPICIHCQQVVAGIAREGIMPLELNATD